MIENSPKTQKTFQKKVSIQIRYLLKPFRNFIANSSFVYRLYILGWLLIFLSLSSIALTTNVSDKYALFLATLVCSIVLFICGFIYEFFLLYKDHKVILKPLLSLLAAITSFVSIFLARWVIIYFTGIEPESPSTASIIFSLAIEICILFSICTVVLFGFYFLSICLSILLLPFSFLLTLDLTKVKNTYFWRFLLRKSKQNLTKKNNYWRIFFGAASRTIGFGVIGVAGFCVLAVAFNISSLYENNLIHQIEEVIVYTNYRPSNKITECHNLKKGEWGFLIKNKKISVAEPHSLGGYYFATKPCEFGEDSPTQPQF
jgi:hypothetical protein